ncbi:MAG: class II glutamine amidotransferase [Candidatus Helarchaeota archaeon]
MCRLYGFSTGNSSNISLSLYLFEILETWQPAGINLDGFGFAGFRKGKVVPQVVMHQSGARWYEIQKPEKRIKMARVIKSLYSLREKIHMEKHYLDAGIAHLRLGPNPMLENCHPFLSWAYPNFKSTRNWVFAHNGRMTTKYLSLNELKQKGTTDSEKVFLFLLEKYLQDSTKRRSFRDTISILASLIKDVVAVNTNEKHLTLNFLFSDGTTLYAFKKSNQDRSRLFFIRRNAKNHRELREKLGNASEQIRKRVRRYLRKTQRLWTCIWKESLEDHLDLYLREWEDLLSTNYHGGSMVEVCSDPFTNRILKKNDPHLEGWHELQDWELITVRHGKLLEKIGDIREF